MRRSMRSLYDGMQCNVHHTLGYRYDYKREENDGMQGHQLLSGLNFMICYISKLHSQSPDRPDKSQYGHDLT